MDRKLLIIKTGCSETFCEKESSDICSFGDVLRTTFILNIFKFYEITWVTDKRAIELLTPYGEEIEILPKEKLSEIDIQKFALVLNFEKDENAISLANGFPQCFGFIRREKELGVRIYPNGEFIPIDQLDTVLEFNESESYQVQLCKILGREFEGNDFDYPYKGKKTNKSDIGLNWQVGPKWPEKSIKQEFWQQLEWRLKDNFSISWQQGFDNMTEYIDWIDSCETVVTLDSLGLHLAIALKKNIIALFGPTNACEVELYERGVKLCYDQKVNHDDEILNQLINKVCDHLI